MGFFTRIIAFIMAIIMTLFPSLGGSSSPETVTVDGVVYRNNFQGDLYFSNDDNAIIRYGDTAVYEKGSVKLYKIENVEYDLLYNVSGDSVAWGDGEDVYCREDQWEELNAYCTNLANFDWLCVVNSGNSSNRYNVENMDVEKFNSLVKFADENEIDPFDLSQNKNLVEVSYDIWHQPRYSFSVVSKNGLFSKGAIGFYVWEGELVMLHHTTGGGETGRAYVVYAPDELSEYFVGIINSLNTQ